MVSKTWRLRRIRPLSPRLRASWSTENKPREPGSPGAIERSSPSSLCHALMGRRFRGGWTGGVQEFIKPSNPVGWQAQGTCDRVELPPQNQLTGIPMGIFLQELLDGGGFLAVTRVTGGQRAEVCVDSVKRGPQ